MTQFHYFVLCVDSSIDRLIDSLFDICSHPKCKLVYKEHERGLQKMLQLRDVVKKRARSNERSDVGNVAKVKKTKQRADSSKIENETMDGTLPDKGVQIIDSMQSK